MFNFLIIKREIYLKNNAERSKSELKMLGSSYFDIQRFNLFEDGVLEIYVPAGLLLNESRGNNRLPSRLLFG